MAAKKKVFVPYEWDVPFLDKATGKVWIHVGYGDWELFDIDSDAAITALEYYRKHSTFRTTAAGRLSMKLSTEQFHREHGIHEVKQPPSNGDRVKERQPEPEPPPAKAKKLFIL